MVDGQDDLVPAGTPDDVRAQAAAETREPCFDPTLGIDVTPAGGPQTKHRFVAIGDSLSHGFQSGAVFNTDLSFPAIVAHELGWSEEYRYPRYGGPGGLPLNIEYLLRDLESRFGAVTNLWELPFALFRAREFLDRLEDYWERGPGSTAPELPGFMHDLAVYGWDLRDALQKTADSCAATIKTPRDNFLDQIIENDSERAALRVYPMGSPADRAKTLFDAATTLGDDHAPDEDCGIETLIIELGSNNALGSVIELSLRWSGDDFRDPGQKAKYTVWKPEHFAAELETVAEKVRQIKARHVIWCTVPHVTIPPITRGVGGKLRPGSRYFPFYTRPWIDDAHFDANRDKHLTGADARAIDAAIDLYNDAIQHLVERARQGADGPARDWYLLDLAGVLDRLASRRYITDANARPSWWSPYPLPPMVAALNPVPDSRFLSSDGKGGRATGGLFSLDGVHPTTVAYGIVAQEIVNIMHRAGVEFPQTSATQTGSGHQVDFARLITRDSLITRPPQNISSTLEIIGWADNAFGLVKRALRFRPQG